MVHPVLGDHLSHCHYLHIFLSFQRFFSFFFVYLKNNDSISPRKSCYEKPNNVRMFPLTPRLQWEFQCYSNSQKDAIIIMEFE